jgi:tRNA-splicing ligase RtcB
MSEPSWKANAIREDESTVRIKQHGSMEVDAMMVADEALWNDLADDRSPQQVVNTASIPGIVGEAWAMADWHYGYGFPIGGVVATDIEAGELGGAISPGGVGFDINCGVRLLSIDIEPPKGDERKEWARKIFNAIPAGASSKGGVEITDTQLSSILSGGAAAAIDLGLGEDRDLNSIESNGLLPTDEYAVSERSLQRGLRALGTLGSGNHFLELQMVDKIVDEKAASAFGLVEGGLTAMIHTGSRGLGHQVCSEHVERIEQKYRRSEGHWIADEWGYSLPDRQLAAAPIHSKEGMAYLDAMHAAGNYAFANRSALTQRLRKTLRKITGGREANVEVVYDVSHNIAKIEEHIVHGKSCKCCVHRKGATRALGGDHSELFEKYGSIGQPVLVPGDMGTASWVLAGPQSGSNRAFASSCHGAGRRMSRKAARDKIDSKSLISSLSSQGIEVRARTPSIVAEEAPEAYKDVDNVIRLTDNAGLARPVARLTPLAVNKG